MLEKQDHKTERELSKYIKEKTGMYAQQINERKKTIIKHLGRLSNLRILGIIAFGEGLKLDKFFDDPTIDKIREDHNELKYKIKRFKQEPKREVKEISTNTEIKSPYDFSLKQYEVDEELIRDCKLIKPYRAAVKEAMLTLETRLRNELNLDPSLTGQDLIKEANKKDLFKQKVESQTHGLYFLFCGAILWFRNPPSHTKVDYRKEDAVKIILFIDYLLKLFEILRMENKL